MGKAGEVLVVEDDPEVNALVGAYADLAGFTHRSAADGTNALREAAEMSPALIVLDVMLPDIDGFEICRRLRLDSRTKDVPIIILTALDEDECRRRGYSCGANAFLNKPFDPDALIEKMQSLANGGASETDW